MKKTLHMQLSTSKQIKSSQRVRTEEIDHVLRVIPQDSTTVVSVRTYIEVVVTNILSRMVLKKPMAVVGSGGDDRGLELEQVKKFRELADELHESIVHKGVGDFIPVLKWFDMGGLTKQLQNLEKNMDAFMSKIVSEHLTQRQSGSSIEKSMADVLDLDQMEDTASKVNITDQHVNNVLWVRTFLHITKGFSDKYNFFLIWVRHFLERFAMHSKPKICLVKFMYARDTH